VNRDDRHNAVGQREARREQHESDADDLLTILIDPLDVKDGSLRTPRQIVNHINEVSFNSSWVLEVRQIELINKLLRQGHLDGSKYREKRFHRDRRQEFVRANSFADSVKTRVNG
jgi:hypothetical protein